MDRKHILDEIRRLAAELGRAPGRQAFEAATGIRTSEWYGRYWARWGDALVEAGFAANAKQGRSDQAYLLGKLAQAFRHYGKVPTDGELRLYRRVDGEFPNHSTLSNNFPTKADMLSRLRHWLSDKQEFADVAAMLPDEAATPTRQRTSTSEGLVYLLRSGAHFKIGRSDTLERRVKEITVALPESVTLVHAIRTDDPSGIEAYWHRRFSERRANGEWFKLTPSDIAAFKRRKYQ